MSRATRGCTAKGGQVVRFAGGVGACRACQCACGPSPRQETMPTPVIQVSCAVSAIGISHGHRPWVSAGTAAEGIGNLAREGKRGRGPLHMRAQLFVGKLDDAKGHLRVAGELAV